MNGIIDPNRRFKNHPGFNNGYNNSSKNYINYSPSPKKKNNSGRSLNEISNYQSSYNYWSRNCSPKKEAVLKKDLIIKELLEKKNEFNNNNNNSISNKTI